MSERAGRQCHDQEFSWGIKVIGPTKSKIIVTRVGVRSNPEVLVSEESINERNEN